jgi:SAM-dependent methyltransferase
MDIDIDIEAEREFHNRRFAEGDSREAQSKYYWAIAPGAHRYWSIVKRIATSSDVLEYGCSTGEKAHELSAVARSVHGIDISDVAIEHANARFSSSAVRYQVMDASKMTFQDCQFDLVFGSGIIHHLDTERSAREIARVLRPGGRAVFWEPLGSNPMINLYRRCTPGARTADEHPLLKRDLDIIQTCFGKLEVSHYGLTSLAVVGIRHSSFGERLRTFFGGIDQALFRVPGMERLAWYCLLQMEKRR